MGWEGLLLTEPCRPFKSTRLSTPDVDGLHFAELLPLKLHVAALVLRPTSPHATFRLDHRRHTREQQQYLGPRGCSTVHPDRFLPVLLVRCRCHRTLPHGMCQPQHRLLVSPHPVQWQIPSKRASQAPGRFLWGHWQSLPQGMIWEVFLGIHHFCDYPAGPGWRAQSFVRMWRNQTLVRKAAYGEKGPPRLVDVDFFCYKYSCR